MLSFGPCFVTSAVPNRFRYPVRWHEPGIPSGHTRDAADWETNIQSGLSRSWNKWSLIEIPYYFSCFVAQFFLQTSLLFISIYKTYVEIITTSWVFQLGIISSAYVLGNATVWPVIPICVHLSSFYSNLPSLNSARSELKCKTGMKEPTYHWHFIKYKQLVLSPF